MPTEGVVEARVHVHVVAHAARYPFHKTAIQFECHCRITLDFYSILLFVLASQTNSRCASTEAIAAGQNTLLGPIVALGLGSR